MLAKRIIPCLDIKNGRTVKGVQFENLRDAGDPVALAARYAAAGADELVFLDITATIEGRKTLLDLVRNIAKTINIPFTVGGGVQTVCDISALLEAGADKIAMNSAAIKRPELISEAAQRFGSQCIVLAIDAKKEASQQWGVYLNGGRNSANLDAVEWAKLGAQLGAGEILLTSMDKDGATDGFELALTRAISENVPIPVIASGGAGSLADFETVFSKGKADAALAASVFHFGEIAIPDLKAYLQNHLIAVRLH